MGTNYYLEPPPREPNKPAGARLHIGKVTAGWAFALHVIPDEGLNDLSDWIVRWSQPGWSIFDEYGDLVDPARMREIVLGRQGLRRMEPPDDGRAYDRIAREFS